jgi:hypothetical protein
MVIKVSPNIKFLEPQSENRSISKTLRYIFIVAQILFGLDYGFLQVKSRKFRMFLKLIPIPKALVLFAYIVYGLIDVENSFLSWYVFEIIICIVFIIITLSCRYTYFDFQADLHSFDREIKADSASYRFDLKIVTFITAVWLYIVSQTILYRYFVNKNHIDISIEVLYVVFTFGSDFVRTTYVFVFSSTYWRITQLKMFVKIDNSQITTCQYLYKSIADITDKAKANYNIVVSIM